MIIPLRNHKNRWFLTQVKEIVDFEGELATVHGKQK